MKNHPEAMFTLKFLTRTPVLLLSSALLLAAAWPPSSLTGLVFFAWVPWLWAEEKQDALPNHRNFGWQTYAMLLIWNVITTYWVVFSSPAGGIFAFIANSGLMMIPLTAYRFTRKHLGKGLARIALPAYWITFEFLHMRWEITWPWLTLGNAFAQQIQWIQWYEYTGHLGGSLWIWLVNMLIFSAAQWFQELRADHEVASRRFAWLTWAIPGIILSAPIIGSILIFQKTSDIGLATEVVIVQPNIDPYREKFEIGTLEQQKTKLIEPSMRGITSETKVVLWPETSVPGNLWINEPLKNNTLYQMQGLLKDYPQCVLMAGFTGFAQYDHAATSTARTFSDGDCCYDVFNAALSMDTGKVKDVYFKSKLVPGVERMPYPGFFKFLGPLAINLGGTVGSMGIQEERSVLFDQSGNAYAPVICYESVFGDYVTEYIQKGAQAILIMTNDGWWQNTAGHIQHLHYASLRAIETRKSIARSANTGISCFINQKGEISQPAPYETAAVIRDHIYLNDIKTYYVKHGDYIGRIAGLLSLLFLPLSFVRKQTGGKRNFKGFKS